MPEHTSRYAKRSLLEGEGGKRKRRRPKKKWLKAVTADVRIEVMAEKQPRRVVTTSIMECNIQSVLKLSYSEFGT
jgi:hypothetical protein